MKWFYLSSILLLSVVSAAEELTPTLTIQHESMVDPDDMCFVTADQTTWMVASDKKANAVFLVDGKGNVLDKATVQQPGNIDSRSAFRSGDQTIPLIVVNGRTREELVAFTVEVTAAGPRLKRLKSDMPTGENYGGCLYSGAQDRIYFFSTTKGGLAQQFEIKTDGERLTSTRVRSWKAPICEGAVADDRHRAVFVCEEQVGIRKLGAEPDSPVDGKLIVKIGDHGITGDLEGITIIPTGKHTGYLIASDQGRNTFAVFDRRAPHDFVGSITIPGVRHTDGVDATRYPFGDSFGQGALAVHTDTDKGCGLVLTPLASLLRLLPN